MERSWDWGNYPSHDKSATWVKEEAVVNGGVVGKSPAENLFTIGGRRFILLDRNLDGEYFVMADEEYGQAGMMTKDEIEALNEQKGSKKGWAVTDWLYDPTTVDSTEWKLTNDKWGLLSGNPDNGFGYWSTYTGDQTKKVIPKEMVDDIVLKDWEIEPFLPITGWQFNSYANVDAKNEKDEWYKNMDTTTVHKVSAKVALMSATEYDTYKSKIGFVNNDTGALYARNTLRTTSGGIGGVQDTGDWTFEPGYVQVGLSGDVIKVAYATALDVKYMMRPVMWLEADFFKNNKIDVATAGETVFTEMRDLYTKEDLAETYTSDEIALIFGEISQLPISNVTFTSGGADIEDITTVSEITVSADFAKDKENCVMILSVYDKDGRVLNTGFTPVDMTDATETVTKTVTVTDFANAASCKVFVVDSFATLTPQFTASK